MVDVTHETPTEEHHGSAGALDLLRGEPAAAALITDHDLIRYDELAQRVARRVAEIGGGRRLVLIETHNDIEPLVTYLAALAGGHVALLVPPESADALIERYDPDVTLTSAAAVLEQRRSGTRHQLHPDLALLLSTSGSTGSPKLVRLSRRNIESNAVSIARYLRLTPKDRAITTLPFSYCYGLSVINSHFVAGAAIRLNSHSVVDPAFWQAFENADCTSFAGVPYTFDLLDAADFSNRRLPTLRYITQAGGRLDPQRVRDYARLGAEAGFDLVVMYGQTEATARMAYLPPELAEQHPDAIGVPIPGGALSVEGADSEGVGELVYRGENVMMGYAESPADLAAGHTLAELRTGDLARLRDDGLFEIVGRLNRFVKVFGLRVDLDRVQRQLAMDGVDARALGIDERLVLAVRDVDLLLPAASRTARLLGLPAHAVESFVVESFPDTSTAKPDWRALELLVRDARENAGATRRDATPEGVRALYAELLDRPDAGLNDSFSSLEGDSLSYVEVSLRLGEVLGALPRDWPAMTVRQLAAHAAPLDPGPSTRGRDRAPLVDIEPSLVLRAVAIVLVTATHANLIDVQGGAHVLLALIGFNLARFQLARVTPHARVRGLIRTAAGIAIPAMLWIGAVALLTGAYRPTTVLLLNAMGGTGAGWSAQWHFWFLEAAVWSIIALAAVMAVPWITRADRRRPFTSALVIFLVAIAIRLIVTGFEAGPLERYTLPATAWLVALGWLIARATTLRSRVAVSLCIAASLPGFFGDPTREAVVAAGLLMLLWLTHIAVPRILVPAIRVLAAASLYIYLVQWQVYPWLEDDVPWLATLASFAAGVLAWQLSARVRSAAAKSFRRSSERRHGTGRGPRPSAALLARGSHPEGGATGQASSPRRDSSGWMSASRPRKSR
ncbi:conserved membrane hypothetical protein [Microbacterium sp. C448]|uniref:AMP-binding protein n=1 Tax=Microbacterium sp. C448 TaxID=1177594 RepID=UPI0003DE2137|nr:AMP-binding protein [Microbacterium sp. C448]CDJ99863.1 conserved membrane hypothetical protein [Microbacterium sp. C448]